jgi:hypothetical protein
VVCPRGCLACLRASFSGNDMEFHRHSAFIPLFDTQAHRRRHAHTHITAKKHSHARSRSHARGRRAARCACRRQSSPCGACGACAARASRPAVSTVHGTRTTDPSTGVACAAAALPRSALAALAVRCQGGRHPSALCEGASRLTRCRGLAWGPMGWHARCGAHLDARRVDEAADEDAVELEAAQPPAAPGTSEKRPAGANAPTGG